jgi:23S rRNA pseudouridine2604 synthase
MATIKLKKPAQSGGAPARSSERSPDRAPVRGTGSGVRKPRPTLAQAEAQRAERDARYQEQLRQRFGDHPPEKFARRDEGPGARPRRDGPPSGRPDDRRPPRRDDDPRRNSAFGGGDERRPPRRDEPPRPGYARDDRRPPERDERRAPFREDQRRATARDDRHPPARDDRRGPGPGPRSERSAPPSPHGPRPSGRNSAFGRDDRPAPPRRAPRARDDDDDDDDVVVHAEVPGSMRLSKRMSELGIASRREADEWIPKGWVRVDGRVVTELGSRVLPEQRITIDAKARHVQAQRVTVLIHKPIGYVSGQAEDGYEPAYVLVKPENQWHEDQSGIRFLLSHLRSLAPAGRLDIDSTGLLVLTQDGRVAKQLIGDDSEIDKEYLVRVKSRDGEPLSQQSLALLNHGLELDGVQLREAQVEWVNDDQLRFVLREGRKRQIRRMCEAVGLDVLGLKRVRIGKVMLGDLPPGQWRYLRLDESFG